MDHVIFRNVRLQHGYFFGLIQRGRKGLPEILIIHSLSPVIRLILRIELRIKVEAVEIGVAVSRPLTADQVLCILVAHPVVQNISCDFRVIDLASFNHLRSNGICFRIVYLLNFININDICIVV